MATKNLLIRGGADFSGMKREIQNVQKSLNSFKDNVSKTTNSIRNTLATIGTALGIKSAVQDAMKLEAAIGQVNRLMGDSAKIFLDWANTQAAAYNMSKSQAIQYGAVYSNLLSTFTKDTQQTMKYTQDLLKATAVIASKTGRSMEDAMERIRSGLLGNTEAVEDLGINVYVNLLESTKAFQQFANGKSWNQLDFQTQSLIRYFAILEQASSKYGVTISENALTKTQQFTAQLGNLRTAFGQAFLPIWEFVLPTLTAMVTKITSVMNSIAQFTKALFGKAPEKQAKNTAKAVQQQTSSVNSLGGALGDTAKAAKKAAKESTRLAGFDEITNIKNSSSADSSGVGSSGGASPVLPPISGGAIDSETSSVPKKFQQMANKVKKVFNDLSKFISKHKDIIISGIGGIVAAFAAYKIISNWSNIVDGIGKAFKGLGGVFTGLSLPILAVAAVIGILVAGIIYLWRTNEDFRNSVIEVWNLIKSTITSIVQGLWETIKQVWDVHGKDIVKGLQTFANSILEIIVNLWENLLKPIISSALNFIKTIWNDHLKGIIKLVLDLVAKLVKSALEIWNKFILPIVNWLVKNLAPTFKSVFNTVLSVIKPLIGVASDVVKGVLKTFGGLIDFITGVFTGNWKKAWNGVKDIFKGVFDSLWSIVKFPLNLIIDGINALIGGINKISFDVPDWVPLIGGKKFGFSIPKIPKLAQGGYVGANNPLLAIIGDNRNEGEIVAPESKLYEQTYNAIKDALGEGGGGTTELIINFGGTTIFRRIIEGINQAQRQAGKTLIEI